MKSHQFIRLLTMICVVGSVHCFWNDTGLEPIIRSEVIRDSECACWDGSDTEWEPECRCVGEKLMDVPKNLSRNVMRLAVDGAGIAVLRASSLQPYRNTLQDFALMNVKNLRVLEGGVFQNLTHLRTIYIYHAPALSTFPSDVFNVELPRLKILRIVHTGLVSPPDLRRLTIPSALMMLLSLIKENFFSNVSNLRYLFLGAQYSELDLENNQIQKLCTGQIQVRTEHLVLNYNVIEEVESRAFENSQVGKLSLRGNRALTTLHPDSFLGLRSLRYLDLSDTSITYLPTTGLHELDVLWIQDTKSLKVFPSVFHFEYIREVYLTYPYHCCAFHFPARHDPEEYDRHLEFMKAVQRACDSQANERTNGDRRRRSSRRAAWGVLLSPASPVTLSSTEANGIFHTNVTVGPGIRIHALCGNVSKKYSDVKCIPSPDAFNPCEDLMGNWALRSAAWVVAVAALIGNFSVLFVLLSSRFRMTVPKFLMCNLAMADLCMGIYLLMIAVMDARSIGDYFNHAIDWQSGAGCRVAGFLTVLGCELSIFTLTVITIERWYTITYAIHLNKRLKLSTTAKIMSLGWVYSLCMASLPLFGISSYSKTSICLPLEKIKAEDMSYLVTLLIFNGLAFWVICTSYARMYCSIKGGQDAVAALTRSDMTVAKRMALLVFTDFACWAPIAFFGVTALAGYPLIDLSKTKILLVFFYPLNSCANPYLYALLTQQYRRDLFVLLSRYGICSLRAARYKGTGVIHRCNTGQSVRNNNEPRRDNSVPNHRGSVLTTVTSLDCPASNTRPGSLTAVPEFSVQQLPLHTLPSEEQRVRHHSNGTNKTASSFL